MTSASSTDEIPRSAGDRPTPALLGITAPAARTSSSSLLVSLCSIPISAVLIVTAFAASMAAAAEPVVLASRAVEIPEAGYVTNAVLFGSRHEWVFLPPSGWKESFDTNTLQITWLSTDYTSMLRLKISLEETATSVNADDLRLAIQRHHPGARIRESFACYTCGSKGIAFDLDEGSGETARTKIRLAFVPSAAGLVEFSLTTPAEQSAKMQLLLSQLMNSFTIRPRQTN